MCMIILVTFFSNIFLPDNYRNNVFTCGKKDYNSFTVVSYQLEIYIYTNNVI